MPSITFQPQLRPVRDVLTTDFYDIPRFQRPYSWTQENLDDFLQDVTDGEDEGYFIGPMVCFKTSKQQASIVDGQQRMTTITVVLAVLRDKFAQIGDYKLAEAVHRYIERDDDDSISHFVLRADAAGSYLQSQIQAKLPRGTTPAKSEEQRALKRAFDEISSTLSMKLEGLSTEDDGSGASEASTELRRIRDRILSLQVIWIQLDSEDDAYLIFETLNSRGKDLEVVDLLKNHLLSGVKAENGDLDSARQVWSEMRTTLETAEANPNKFILHWWLSNGPYTAERNLYKLLRKEIEQADCGATLQRLRADAGHYSKIASPLRVAWDHHDRDVRDSLAALELFGVRQPRPFLLALIRAYVEGPVKHKTCARVLSAIEAFHFITTAVVGSSSTGGVSQMYAKYAREVTGARSSNEVGLICDKLVAKLQSSMAPRESFVAEFGRRLRFGESETGAKRLVQYALNRTHKHARPNHPLDLSLCNIEHIHPQSSAEDWARGIGNLVLIGALLNGQLGTSPFEAKRMLLQKHRAAYDLDLVLCHESWGEREVDERARVLAERGYDEIWQVK